MNNLKRVLSLALSGIMLVGMMAVGAGAVNGKDFTDKDEITHNEAVNTLVTLNVINGKDDGSHYDPKGTLTRAEMCKLIVYVLNGGKEPVMSTKTTPSYSDIKGHWAEKYIEYCSNLKIVAGQGDGTFNPGGVLTGSQAAKMMLTAMNYNSDVFHFTGADWELNVNSEANKAKLYKDLDGMDASAPISRDDAAQLVYNGILANTMYRTWNQNMSDLAITETYQLTGAPLFSSKFDGVAYEGTLIASGKYGIADSAPSSDYFEVDLQKIDNVELPTTSTTGPVKGDNKAFKYVGENLTALMGEYVKVLYNSKDKIVYGVYRVEDMNTVISTTTNVPDVKADYIEIDGTRYNKDSGFTVYGNGGTIDGDSTDKVKFVDNDGDDDLDVAIVVPQGVAKVTFVGTDSITLSDKGGNATLKASNQKTKDMIVYDGIAKNDYVVYYRDMYKNKDVLEKAELVEAGISGIGGSSQERTLIDGKWYKKAASSTVYNGGTPVVGDTVKFIALDNKIYYMEKVSGAQSVEDLAMVITASTDTGLDGNRVKLLFSDGSKKTVTLAAHGTNDDNDKAVLAANVGKLFSFEINNSGEYVLNLAEANAWKDAAGTLTSKMGDYTFVTATTNDLGTSGTQIAKAGTFAIADDAVVFVLAAVDATPALKADNDGKVMTGKELKALYTGTDNTTIATTTQGFFTSANNGLTRATVLCVTLGAAATDGFNTLTGTSANNYGYLVSDATYTKENGTNYIVMKLWNGEETIDVKWAKSNAATAYTSYKKHNVIGYDTKGEGEITNVTHLVNDIIPTVNNNVLTNAAITGLDGKDISFTTATGAAGTQVYKITGDTKILYVNSGADSAGAIGVADGNVALANRPAGTDSAATAVYVQNAKYMFKKVGNELRLEVLVYDVNNMLADRTNTASIADITPTWTNIKSIVINGAEYTSGKIKLAPGDVVKVTADTAAVTVTNMILDADAAAGTVSASKSVAAGKTATFIMPNLGTNPSFA